MIAAIRWAREQKVPFLGICLGFQMRWSNGLETSATSKVGF